MGKDVFNFGKVKGIDMEDVLNMENIHSTFSGLQYLWGMYNITNHKNIKDEIETCFKKYSCSYIIKFGEYKDLSLNQIDEIDSGYVENYLPKNNDENIRIVVKSYLKHCRNKNRSEFNPSQRNLFLLNNELHDQINARDINEIERVLNNLGIDLKNKKLRKCPFGCDSNTESVYHHAYLIKARDGSYIITCTKCGTTENFIKFISNSCRLGHVDTLRLLARELNISISNGTSISVEEIKKNVIKYDEEIVFEKSCLPEIVDLNDYGFSKGNYLKVFYNRGFTEADAEEMEVYFAGENCRNGFRDRICFVIKDLDNRIVGITGRYKYEEDYHYNYWIKRLGLDLKLTRDKQVEEVKRQGCRYKKYYNQEGFKKGAVLYNANKLVCMVKDEVIITEGLFDVAKMVLKHGYKNTVGMMGSTVSKGQLFQLYELYKDVRETIKIYLFVDNDETGLRTFEKNVKELQEVGFKNVYKMILTEGKDAGEATKEQVDQAYKLAEPQDVRYKKKRIIINDIGLNEKIIDEE